MVKFFSNYFWIHLPPKLHKVLSHFFSKIFHLNISRWMIAPYCLFFNLNTDYLNQFEPASSSESYISYSDFFRRKYKVLPQAQSPWIWPCEGYVCDWGSFKEKKISTVKGQALDLNTIFGTSPHLTQDHFFINIFLHNHNYHRVHAPVSGTVKQMIQIPGSLHFLRPWFYKRADVSFPAFKNERLVLEIEDLNKKTWYMAIVGGFGVGSIAHRPELHPGSFIHVGQELAHFNLGSTVCLASPCVIQIEKYLETTRVGEALKIKSILSQQGQYQVAHNHRRDNSASNDHSDQDINL